MKKVITGSEKSTIEITNEEMCFIIYCYETSNGKSTKEERAFIEQIKALTKEMENIKNIETSIKSIFNK